MTSPIPADAIQRVLFVCTKVHVYSIPPLTSNKGYVAASWTENNNAREIFVARVRVIETSVPPPSSDPVAPEKISVDVLLEDPKTADLFAAAPYRDKSVVEPAVDSSRFYAIRVVGDGGQKATLGIGFEDRSESIDFGISLQECRKVLGYESRPQAVGGSSQKAAAKSDQHTKKDWSLKEGETIKIDIGKNGPRSQTAANHVRGDDEGGAQAALFSIKPPPAASSSTSIPILAPPPSAPQRSEKRRSRRLSGGRDKEDLGFDDEYVFLESKSPLSYMCS